MPEWLPEIRPPTRVSRPRLCIEIVVLVLGTIAVYGNTLRNGFITWDDSDYLYQNELVKAAADTGELPVAQAIKAKANALYDIWTDLANEKPHEQYYPMVFTSFWLEHQLVGFSQPVASAPQPLYHGTQLALHAANAVLLLIVFRWLGFGVWPSFVAAALFVVHPTNVASVGWITERKNTLSQLFVFLSMLAYVRFRRREGVWLYGLAIVCFQFSLFSKTAVFVLAPLLIVTDRLLDRRWTATALLRAMPFFALGAGMALITMKVEQMQVKDPVPHVIPPMRPLIACAALTHYAGKIIAPVGLAPLYPRWAKSYSLPRYWLSLAGVLIAAILLIRYRRWLGDEVIWGAAWFVLGLFPMLGFQHFNYLQYSFVADHYLYFSGPGLFLILGIAVERLRLLLQPAASEDAPAAPNTAANVIVGVMTCAVLAGLAYQTIAYNPSWKDGVTLWHKTLERNPDCFPANFNLGNHYKRIGEYERAIGHYQEAARIDNTIIRCQLHSAECSADLKRVDDADRYYAAAMETAARKGQYGFSVRMQWGNYLRGIGRLDQALVQYRKVMEGVDATRNKAGRSSYQPFYDDAHKGVVAIEQAMFGRPGSPDR